MTSTSRSGSRSGSRAKSHSEIINQSGFESKNEVRSGSPRSGSPRSGSGSPRPGSLNRSGSPRSGSGFMNRSGTLVRSGSPRSGTLVRSGSPRSRTLVRSGSYRSGATGISEERKTRLTSLCTGLDQVMGMEELVQLAQSLVKEGYVDEKKLPRLNPAGGYKTIWTRPALCSAISKALQLPLPNPKIPRDFKLMDKIENVPDELEDPIMIGSLMVNPVILSTGTEIDLSTITTIIENAKRLGQNPIDPVKQIPFNPDILIPAETKRKSVSAFLLAKVGFDLDAFYTAKKRDVELQEAEEEAKKDMEEGKEPLPDVPLLSLCTAMDESLTTSELLVLAYNLENANLVDAPFTIKRFTKQELCTMIGQAMGVSFVPVSDVKTHIRDENVPLAFNDPSSKIIMRHPVKLSNGNIYDRLTMDSVIKSARDKNKYPWDPITMEIIDPVDVDVLNNTSMYYTTAIERSEEIVTWLLNRIGLNADEFIKTRRQLQSYGGPESKIVAKKWRGDVKDDPNWMSCRILNTGIEPSRVREIVRVVWFRALNEDPLAHSESSEWIKNESLESLCSFVEFLYANSWESIAERIQELNRDFQRVATAWNPGTSDYKKLMKRGKRIARDLLIAEDQLPSQKDIDAAIYFSDVETMTNQLINLINSRWKDFPKPKPSRFREIDLVKKSSWSRLLSFIPQKSLIGIPLLLSFTGLGTVALGVAAYASVRNYKRNTGLGRSGSPATLENADAIVLHNRLL